MNSTTILLIEDSLDDELLTRHLLKKHRLGNRMLIGEIKLRGDLRLFPRMNTLLSIDAKPHAVTMEEHDSLHSTDKADESNQVAGGSIQTYQRTNTNWPKGF